MGIVRFATLSDGRFYTPLNSFRRHEQRLNEPSAEKPSTATTGERRTLEFNASTFASLMRAAITCIRSHTLLAKATRLCVEDLRVSAMSKSDGPAAKRRLNRSILDQGWFEFRRQLEYKLRWGVGPRTHRRVHARLLTCADAVGTSGLSRGRMPSSTWNTSGPPPFPRPLGIFALGHQKRRTRRAAW
jgi:putative transposase